MVPRAVLALLLCCAPAAPADEDPPAPGDLAVEASVGDTPSFLPPAEVPFTFTLHRTGDAPLRGVLVAGTPDGDRELPYDGAAARRATVATTLPPGDTLLRAVAGGVRLLDMDLRIESAEAWWVAGPFPLGTAVNLHQEFALETAPPSVAAPGPWRLLDPGLRGPDGAWDLLAAFPGTDRRTVLLATRFLAAKPGRARLLLGSDDSLRVLWNGRPVLSREVVRPCRPAEDLVTVDLLEGENTLVLKVCNDGLDWGFACSLDDGAGGPVEGLLPLLRPRLAPTGDGRIHVEDVTRDGAVLSWRTALPVPTRLVLSPLANARRPPAPPGVPKEAMLGSPGPPRVLGDPLPSTRHRVVVDGLLPGARYDARAGDGARGTPPPAVFRTAPPEGWTQVLRLRVAVVLFTNAVPARDALRAGARDGVPEEEIARAERAFEEAARFAFRNSGMKLWLDNEFLEDREFRSIPEGAIYGVGLQPGGGHEEALLRLLAERGESPRDFDAVVYATLSREWDGREWVRPFSGGGTYGPHGRFGVGNSSFKAGHDAAWLYTHEVGHQVDALYDASGAPEYLFNHFQPWDGTAHRHGEHFDGNAWLLRWWAGLVDADGPRRPASVERIGFRWFLSFWGETVVVADGDGDGVPDDDPRLPLDERRLGSAPRLRDTDGDGLDDLGEALATEGVEQGLQEVWAGPASAHRCDPRNPDSDGDGLRDGEDPDPLFAAPPEVPAVGEGAEGGRGGGVLLGTVDEEEFRGAFLLAWDPARGELVLEGRCATPFREIRVLIDADDDGWFVGRDNLEVLVNPSGVRNAPPWTVVGGGACGAALHNAGVPGKGPFHEAGAVPGEDVAFAWSAGEEGGGGRFRLALRRCPGRGLDLVPGEPLGIRIGVLPEGGVRRPGWEGAYSLFEPHVLLHLRLR